MEGTLALLESAENQLAQAEKILAGIDIEKVVAPCEEARKRFKAIYKRKKLADAYLDDRKRRLLRCLVDFCAAVGQPDTVVSAPNRKFHLTFSIESDPTTRYTNFNIYDVASDPAFYFICTHLMGLISKQIPNATDVKDVVVQATKLERVSDEITKFTKTLAVA